MRSVGNSFNYFPKNPLIKSALLELMSCLGYWGEGKLRHCLLRIVSTKNWNPVANLQVLHDK